MHNGLPHQKVAAAVVCPRVDEPRGVDALRRHAEEGGQKGGGSRLSTGPPSLLLLGVGISGGGTLRLSCCGGNRGKGIGCEGHSLLGRVALFADAAGGLSLGTHLCNALSFSFSLCCFLCFLFELSNRYSKKGVAANCLGSTIMSWQNRGCVWPNTCKMRV